MSAGSACSHQVAERRATAQLRRRVWPPWRAPVCAVLVLALHVAMFARAARVDAAPVSWTSEAGLGTDNSDNAADGSKGAGVAGMGSPVCDSCRARGEPAPTMESLAALAGATRARRLAGGYDVVFALSDSLNDGDTTSLVSVTLTIGFATGSVTGFEASDFDVQGCSVTSLSGGGNIYTATLSLFGRDVVVLLPAGSVEPSPSNNANQVSLTYGACRV